jgi:diacylglycerol kinase family enzyme
VIRPGTPWGEPVAGDPGPVVDVTGSDADLAAAAAARGGALLRYVPGPGADFARALGIGPDGGAGTTVAACDLLDLGHGQFAVNAVVLGVAPDRLRARHRLRPVLVEVDGRAVFDGSATTVVVAGGQFLRGADLVPRGHPGDGRVEVQVYALHRAERRAMRARLAGGDHVPHPRIAQASGRRVLVRWDHREAPLEVDGRALATAGELEIVVRPGAVRVLL